MVFEMLIFSLLSHLTQLIARENFIILSGGSTAMTWLHSSFFSWAWDWLWWSLC